MLKKETISVKISGMWTPSEDIRDNEEKYAGRCEGENVLHP